MKTHRIVLVLFLIVTLNILANTEYWFHGDYNLVTNFNSIAALSSTAIREASYWLQQFFIGFHVGWFDVIVRHLGGGGI